ncbi:MAG: hypothetical protein FJZ01_24420 [Candidatus Sericytochromatia bacterium]|nr:hypothetical protein [Candidatus Tanganyikabacteria bacterium]
MTSLQATHRPLPPRRWRVLHPRRPVARGGLRRWARRVADPYDLFEAKAACLGLIFLGGALLG